MLRAETNENKESIRQMALVGNFGAVYNDGIEIDGYITFDQMHQIVEYLRLSREARYWERWNKHNVEDEQKE